MKAILILVVAALVVHAGARMGDSIWRHMQLEDEVEREARLGDHKTTSALRQRVIQIAGEHDVALTERDVTVEMDGRDLLVAFEYSEMLPLLPQVYTYERMHDVTLQVEPVRPLLVDDRK